MRRSVAVNERDFRAEPSFSQLDHEIETKDGETTDRTYESVMMDGTPYRRLIAEDGRPALRRSASVRSRSGKRVSARADAPKVSAIAKGASQSTARIGSTITS